MYYYPSFSQSYSSPSVNKPIPLSNSYNNQLYNKSNKNNMLTASYGDRNKEVDNNQTLKNIQNRFQSIENQFNVREEIINAFNRNSDKNIGIYNPYIGNPILGKSVKTESKSVTPIKIKSPIMNSNKLESLEYQNLIQEQMIQQRKEKLQENNIHMNNLIFQEVDEISDNLELFKMEMFNYMRKLERNQEKQNYNHVVEEVTHVKDLLKSSLDRIERKRDNEIKVLKDEMNLLRDDINDNLRNESKMNRNLFKQMNNELRMYRENMNDKFELIERPNIMDARNEIRKIHQDSTRALAEQLMNEKDKEDIDINEKVNSRYNRRGGVIEQNDHSNNSGRQALQINNPALRRRGAIIEDDDQNDNDKSDINPRKRNGINYNRSDSVNYNKFKIKMITYFKKYVHAIIFINKISKYVIDIYDNISLITIKDFISNYEYCVNSLNKWVYMCINEIYNDIINDEYLNIDLTDKTDNLKYNSMQKEVNLIINKIFKSITLSTNTDKIDKKSITFLKSLYTSNNFIPFKFYCLFELSRLKTFSGCIVNLKEQHQSMILSIYILVKILGKNILIDMIFTPSLEDVRIKKNFKFIASVIYHETIEMYSKYCKIEHNIANYEEYILKQKPLGDKKCRVIIHPDIDKKYAAVLNRYNHKIDKSLTTNSSKTLKILSNINGVLPYNKPDRNPNEIDYILKDLYIRDQVSVYLPDLYIKELIYDWVKEFIIVIHNVK